MLRTLFPAALRGSSRQQALEAGGITALHTAPSVAYRHAPWQPDFSAQLPSDDQAATSSWRIAAHRPELTDTAPASSAHSTSEAAWRHRALAQPSYEHPSQRFRSFVQQQQQQQGGSAVEQLGAWPHYLGRRRQPHPHQPHIPHTITPEASGSSTSASRSSLANDAASLGASQNGTNMAPVYTQAAAIADADTAAAAVADVLRHALMGTGPSPSPQLQHLVAMAEAQAAVIPDPGLHPYPPSWPWPWEPNQPAARPIPSLLATLPPPPSLPSLHSLSLQVSHLQRRMDHSLQHLEALSCLQALSALSCLGDVALVQGVPVPQAAGASPGMPGEGSAAAAHQQQQQQQQWSQQESVGQFWTALGAAPRPEQLQHKRSHMATPTADVAAGSAWSTTVSAPSVRHLSTIRLHEPPPPPSLRTPTLNCHYLGYRHPPGHEAETFLQSSSSHSSVDRTEVTEAEERGRRDSLSALVPPEPPLLSRLYPHIDAAALEVDLEEEYAKMLVMQAKQAAALMRHSVSPARQAAAAASLSTRVTHGVSRQHGSSEERLARSTLTAGSGSRVSDTSSDDSELLDRVLVLPVNIDAVFKEYEEPQNPGFSSASSTASGSEARPAPTALAPAPPAQVPAAGAPVYDSDQLALPVAARAAVTEVTAALSKHATPGYKGRPDAAPASKPSPSTEQPAVGGSGASAAAVTAGAKPAPVRQPLPRAQAPPTAPQIVGMPRRSPGPSRLGMKSREGLGV